MDKETELHFLNILQENHIWYQIGGLRYSGNDEYHNWYKIGYNEKNIIGEIEFSKNPTWRVSYYKNGRTYYDSGFLVSNTQRLINLYNNYCLPGIKLKKIDEKKAEIEKDFM